MAGTGTKTDPVIKDRKTVNFNSASPTNLVISRNGNVFTVDWTKGQTYGNKGYKKARYRWLVATSFGTGVPGFTEVAGTVTSGQLTLNLADYYPNTGCQLLSLTAEVKGIEDDYTTTATGYNKDKKKYWKQDTVHNAQWSAVTTATMMFSTPAAPTAQLAAFEDRTEVAYQAQGADDTNLNSIFRKVLYHTGYSKDIGDVDDAYVWNGPYELQSPSGTIVTDASNGGAHGASDVTAGESYTMSFSIWARYANGGSVNVRTHYVYAWPYQANWLSATTPARLSTGLRFDLHWNKVADGAHPSETHCVQYCIGEPRQGMAMPISPSWQGDLYYRDKAQVEQAETITTSSFVDEEEALWVRVIQKHGNFDGGRFETASEPLFVSFGGVKAPTANDITVDSYNSSNGAWSVSVDNPSNLAGSYVRLTFFVRKATNTYVKLAQYNVPASGTWTGNLPVGTSQVRISAATIFGTYESSEAFINYNPTVSATNITAFAPTNVVVTPDPVNCRLNISWNKVFVANGSKTRITVATSESAWEQTPQIFVIDQSVTGTSVALGDLAYDTPYWVRLQATDSGGSISSDWTNKIRTTINSSEAPIPTDFNAVEATDASHNHQLMLTWSWTWNNATALRVTYSDEGPDISNRSVSTEIYDKRSGAGSEVRYLTLERNKTWYLSAAYQTPNGAWSREVHKAVSLVVTPQTPTNVTFIREKQDADEVGKTTARLSWTHSWADADSYEISYAKSANAWDTTEGATSTSYEGSERSKLISGLDLGVDWYARVRLSWDGKVQSDYGISAKLDLRTIPSTPIVHLSKNSISQFGSLDISWSYDNEDLSEQAGATVTVKNASNEVVASISAGTVKAVALYAEQYGITGGSSGIQTYSVTVQTRSANGKASAESEAAFFTVANTPIISVESTSLDNGELTEMPFEATIDGAERGGLVTVMIERSGNKFLEKPDGTTQHGYDGELIAIYEGDGDVVITQDMLRQPLENGGTYKIIAYITNEYGVSDTVIIPFTVAWEEYPVIPDGSVEMDEENLIAKITPTLPTGAPTGCTCDIYRLSADRPELIVKNATWGETYVDPYPAFGENGGHRIVLMTSTGDYVTEDGDLAWLDINGSVEAGSGETTQPILEVEDAVIDFDSKQIFLHYNVDVSHSWSKDFTETKYLGGSIQGDWNPAISRTGSVSAIMLNSYDDEMILLLRQLAAYAGVCHVRTPDGSSFAADVEVSESRPHNTKSYRTEYSLSITRVDSEMLDGMYLSDWEEPSETEGE